MTTSAPAKCLRQASRRLLFVPPPPPCSICRCVCGRPLLGSVSSFTTSSERKAKPAPSVRRAPKKVPKRIPLIRDPNAAIAEANADVAAADTFVYDILMDNAVGLERLAVDSDQLRDFVKGLPRLRQIRVGNRVAFEENSLRKLCHETGVLFNPQDYAMGDALFIAMQMRRNREQRVRQLSRVLVFSLGMIGDRLAILILAQNAFRKHQVDGKTLLQPEIVKLRSRLQKIAISEDDFPAMVLEGHILEQLNDEDGAIRLWNRAVPLALSDSKNPLVNRGAKVGPELPVDLLSPWIELANVHRARALAHEQRRRYEASSEEAAKSKAAVDVGVEADDPIAHYIASLLATDMDGTYSSTWLFHITKVAMSGHASAAFELGVFYGTQRWPFVADDPPDNLRPTPFDLYPSTYSAKFAGLTERLKAAIGLRPPPDGNRFEFAAYPTTPEMRMQTAIQWLEASMALHHAPSYFLMARYLLQTHLPGDLAVPKEALALSPERYAFGSYEEYDSREYGWKRSPKQEMPDVPNPHRNPERAKEMIREVFYAATAHRWWRWSIEQWAMEGRKPMGEALKEAKATGLEEGWMPTNCPEHLSKWVRFPEVRASYSKDSAKVDERVLFDHTLGIDDLESEAKKICDQERWDIYDPLNVLVYRHKG